jgi:predicted phosphoribosyltransferase/dienelactone hydrolase
MIGAHGRSSSSSPAGFVNREDAAQRLAQALSRYRGSNPLVLAIPRGGVPIGRRVADMLGGELDVALVRKLGAPHSPELAIGAVDEDGRIQTSDLVEHLGVDHKYVVDEAARQLAVIRARRMAYSPHRSPRDPAGRTVIVVDDGLATGATMGAALLAVRARNPQHLVCAVPVAARGSLAAVANLADDVVCLLTPADFYAVGQFYDDFSAVDDSEAIRLLAAEPSVAVAPATSVSRSVRIAVDDVLLEGDLEVPTGAHAIVIFVHGSGSSRTSPRNRFVASELSRLGLATLLFDLLTETEDRQRAARFDIATLTARLETVTDWIARDPVLGKLRIGLFGASTGAAAALAVAALRPGTVGAVVSRGGRPDLASDPLLARVNAPTLLIVGGADSEVLELNRRAQLAMTGTVELRIVPGATHLFEEAGALERVAALAGDWFRRWLTG